MARFLPNRLNRNPNFVTLIPYAQQSVSVSSKPRSQICVNSFLNRLYDVDRNNVHHFKTRGSRWWIRRPGDLVMMALLGVLGCALYLKSLETVPYSNRRRLIILSTYREKRIGEWRFKREKSGEYKGRILPASHPDNIRVQKIAREVIGAARRALREDRHRGTQTSHVEEFNWEVIVVDNPFPNAYCYPGGKIVVNSGLVPYAESDTEIALVIAHEVGHAVARHCVDEISRSFWVIFFLVDFLSSVAFKVPDYFLERSYSRRTEREADYIGLFLTAYAGYDPRLAPQMWERKRCMKMRNRSEFPKYLSKFEKYFSTHPSHEERDRLLSHPKVMEEAISIYRETLSRSNS